MPEPTRRRNVAGRVGWRGPLLLLAALLVVLLPSNATSTPVIPFQPAVVAAGAFVRPSPPPAAPPLRPQSAAPRSPRPYMSVADPFDIKVRRLVGRIVGPNRRLVSYTHTPCTAHLHPRTYPAAAAARHQAAAVHRRAAAHHGGGDRPAGRGQAAWPLWQDPEPAVQGVGRRGAAPPGPAHAGDGCVRVRAARASKKWDGEWGIDPVVVLW